MTAFEQALTAFKRGENDVQALIRAAISQLASEPGCRAALLQALQQAFVEETLSADAYERAKQALDATYASISTIRDVDLTEDGEEEEATVFAGAQVGVGPTVVASASVVTEKSAAADIEVGEQTTVLRSGQVLHGRFELQESIGEGGMGIIFRALDRIRMEAKDRDPYVALKVLSGNFSSHPDSLMALQREARNCMRLNHDNIVRVHDFDADEDLGHHYMVMEYLRGEPLSSYAQREAVEGMSADEAWPLVEKIGEALKHAHGKNIIHSDIKPGNIMVTESGDIKVLDFGIARAVNPDTLTVWHGVGAATPRYASPEQLRREEPDARDDVYALACVTYELLTGQHPFQRTDGIEAEQQGLVAERPRGLKRRQWRALSRALKFEREGRTASIDEFLEGFGPATAETKPIMPMLFGIVALAGALAAGLVYSPGFIPTLFDSEGPYVEALLALPVNPVLGNEETERLLEVGYDYVAWGREDFEDGQYQRGNAQLKNGASTAFRPFHQIVTGTDDPDKRLAAARAIQEIDDLYLDEANWFIERSLEQKALWMTCQGLPSKPDDDDPWLPASPELESLYAKLWRLGVDDPSPSFKLGCNRSNVPDAWGENVPLRGLSR